MNNTRLIAGAMSGTSADGVDIALVRIEGGGLEMSPVVLWHHHRPYPTSLRQQIFSIRSASSVALADLAELARQVSLNYAAAVNECLVAARYVASDLACIAAHGQTLFHDPPLTIQWLDPALLAAEVGCCVVSDFRRADCALGGQGAPLVPFADYILFRHPTKNRVLVNIGGIANLTFLPAGADLQWVVAFDTGPGNCISDWLMRQHAPQGPAYDENGRRAGGGTVIQAALDRFLGYGYFWQRPPKSTDIPTMIDRFRSSFAEKGIMASLADYPLNDLLATAARAAAESLTQAIFRFLPAEPDEVVLSGGGVHNRAIVAHLKDQLKSATLLTTDDLGIKSESKEALAFALLAAATLDGLASNVPSVTGASRPAVLGSVTPRP
jgi:anhydro-N-acetylmuramic acid kinase